MGRDPTIATTTQKVGLLLLLAVLPGNVKTYQIKAAEKLEATRWEERRGLGI